MKVKENYIYKYEVTFSNIQYTTDDNIVVCKSRYTVTNINAESPSDAYYKAVEELKDSITPPQEIICQHTVIIQENIFNLTTHDIQSTRYYKGILETCGIYGNIMIEPMYQMYDIIKDDNVHTTEEKEEVTLADFLYEFMHMGNNYHQKLEDLTNLALPETWQIQSRDNYFVLKNYLCSTLEKALEQGKTYQSDKHFIFNTGLYTQL